MGTVINHDRSTDIRRRVAADSAMAFPYTPPVGETLVITRMFGSASMDGQSWVEIVWDAAGSPDPLFVTYGSFDFPIEHRLVGDGAKILRIRLVNNHPTDQRLLWCGYVAHRRA